MRHTLYWTFAALVALVAVAWLAAPALAQPVPPTVPVPQINLGVSPARKPQDVVLSLQLLLLLTILALAPAILVLMTAFTRVIVVLSFVRTAIGTQQVPPNQVLVGLALLLTFWIMNPVFTQINHDALQPYLQQKISQGDAINKALVPLRAFMFKQTREKDIAVFYKLSKEKPPAKQDDVPTYLLVPAFVISELKTAMEIGFAVYVPFIVIDMTVASILLSMGMMMIPPALISLPFKIMVFLLVDGWNLTINAIFTSYQT